MMVRKISLSRLIDINVSLESAWLYGCIVNCHIDNTGRCSIAAFQRRLSLICDGENNAKFLSLGVGSQKGGAAPIIVRAPFNSIHAVDCGTEVTSLKSWRPMATPSA